MGKLKDKVIKRKRKHVSWYDVYLEIGDMNMSMQYFSLLQKHPRMSKNRIAYYVLKSNYSTTALEEMREAAYGLY